MKRVTVFVGGRRRPILTLGDGGGQSVCCRRRCRRNAAINNIADLLEKGDVKAAQKIAKQTADKGTDIEDFMNAFKLWPGPRRALRCSCWLSPQPDGVGPKANAVQPDGIELKIDAIARDGITPATLQKEGPASLEPGRHRDQGRGSNCSRQGA